MGTGSPKHGKRFLSILASSKFPFVMLILTIVAAACSLTAVNTLWPILLKTRFDWGPKEFAYVSAAEVLAIGSALTAYPRVAAFLGGGRIGGVRAAQMLAAL